MKIYTLKQKVYKLTSTQSTQQLKQDRPDLITGKDLRRQQSWISIYNTFKLIDNFHQEQTQKTISEQYGFKTLNATSSFQDLLANVESLGRLYNFLEEQVNKLEFKISTSFEKDDF